MTPYHDIYARPPGWPPEWPRRQLVVEHDSWRLGLGMVDDTVVVGLYEHLPEEDELLLYLDMECDRRGTKFEVNYNDHAVWVRSIYLFTAFELIHEYFRIRGWAPDPHRILSVLAAIARANVSNRQA